MDHGYFKDRISGYLDGELPDYEREAMREHLEGCAECRGVYEDLKKLDLLVERHSGLDGDEYWEAQAQKIEARLGIAAGSEVVDIAEKRRWGFGWKLAAVAASVGVLTFIGLNQTDILRQGDNGEKQMMQSPSVADTMSAETGAPERAAQDTQSPNEVEPEVTRQEKASREGVAEDQEQEADRSAGVVLKKEPVEGGRAVQPPLEEQVEVQTAPAPPAMAPKQEEVSRKPVTDVRAFASEFADESAERFQAAEREESSAAWAPVRLAPSMSFQGGSSAVTQASSLTPAARIVTGTLTVPEPSDRLTLADWIDRSDSLQTVWNELSRARKTLTMQSRKDKAAFSDVHLVERQLIEAQFNVGRLAAGENEAALDEAVGFLREYVERPEARYRSTARMYLDQLAPAGSDD